MTLFRKEIAQPQVVIQSDGRINIPKKEDGSVWTLEEPMETKEIQQFLRLESG